MKERLAEIEGRIPWMIRDIFRGIGQVFFQENALTGACFAIGIALSSPMMALGCMLGASIGTATARLLRFDHGLISAGIYGFNACLVGIATFFYFEPGAASFGILFSGSVIATLATWVLRKFLPFPTYTSPFVITTWVLYFVGPSLGAVWVGPGSPNLAPGVVGAIANGISQVMFQANLATAIFFILGIALSDWRHAVWVVAASAMGVLVANYHVTPAQRELDPERLIQRFLSENINLGLYSYNATLPAIALFLWRKSLIPALLGILLSVPLTELVPKLGIPALTAPFIIATWLVLIFGWFDERFLARSDSPPA
ncbi:MAG: urea transporter [Isosphaeraceae bacterium]|nr:urea transporter [Isosphaeraceae bacterium]